MKIFGPNTCKPFIPEPYTHRAEIPPDDGGPITFRWHFPPGTLSKRMSGLELAEFIINHMPAILPLLGGQPRIKQEFAAMLGLLVTMPKNEIDTLLPWIRSVVKQADDETIFMSLHDKTEQFGPLYFVMP